MVAYVSRESWGAQHGAGAQLRGPLSKIVVHHAVGPATFSSFDAECAYLRQVEHAHVTQRKFKGIGYSFVIINGRIFEGRGWLREGAHTEGLNSTAHAICYAGNGEHAPAPPESWAAAGALIEAGIRAGYVTPSPTVTGHRDHDSTACPGQHNYRLLDLLEGITGVGTEREEDGMASAEYEALSEQIAELRKVVFGQTGAIYNTANKQHGEAMSVAWSTNSQVAGVPDRVSAVEAELRATRQLLDELTRPPAPDPSAARTEVLPPVPPGRRQ